ncbi:MAG: Gfo/Idh/MocA family protein [Limisphaerales bacterium]
MKNTISPTTRREFLKTTGRIAAASALAGISVPSVHAQGSDTVQVALVGCGGRGTGAAANAMDVNKAPVKLIAMADVFEDRLKSSHDSLAKKYSNRMDVPEERKFIGFDAYKHAMDCLKPGDIAIFTTPLAFRWVHFTYAISKGLNVFMEKPLTADGPTSRRMLKLADEASAKNLKVGVGLMSRHSRALQELSKRIQDGELGEIILMRGYRNQGPVGSAFTPRKSPNETEVAHQIRRFHSFIWASGGCFNDFNIHIIDHLCWMKNAWPVKAQAIAGRHYRGDNVDQNFDNYAIEYTFGDGTKLMMDGRCVYGCQDVYASYIHGSKGMAIASKYGDCGMPSSTFSSQNLDRSKMIWTSQVSKEESDPYQNEWNELVEAIRNNKPYNEVPRGVRASVVSSMGRYAAHTGQEMSYEEMLNHTHVYAPNVETMTMDGPAPVMSDAEGRYPIPQPGICTKTEYPIS